MYQESGNRKFGLLPLAGGLAFGLATMIAAPVQASVINSWDVTVNSVFTNTQFTSGGGSTTVAPQKLRWGISTVSGGAQSGLDLANTNPSTVVTNGATANNTTVTHHNNPITGASLKNTTLNNTVTLMPTGGGSSSGPLTLDFNINFNETTNNPSSSTCADGAPNGSGINGSGCADIFVIGQDSLNKNFSYDGEDYFFSFFNSQNGLMSLSSEACQTAGAGSACLGFETPEGGSTSINFASKITTEAVTPPDDGTPVPAPGGFGLFGLALVGMGLALRRRVGRRG